MTSIALGDDVRVHVVTESTFALDGGAMFGVVPRVVWEKTDPPDDRNRVRLACNVTVIQAHGATVLVDTGLGERWTAQEQARYAIVRQHTLARKLAEVDVEPEEVDFVVNTHLHFDHAGGNTETSGAAVSPAFPRARYVVQKGEWEDAAQPHERSRASYRPADLLAVEEAGQLELVDGEHELVPGLRVVKTGGHTAHHQMVRVDAGGETLVVPSDLLPTTSHLPLPYVMSYDLHPVDTLAAKRRLLGEAADGGWWVVFYHDVRVPLAQVERRGDRFFRREL